MSANIDSDKEVSTLLKLAAAALDAPDSFGADEIVEIIASLDRTAAALDFRRGLTGED